MTSGLSALLFSGESTVHVQRKCHDLPVYLPASLPNVYYHYCYTRTTSSFPYPKFQACDIYMIGHSMLAGQTKVECKSVCFKLVKAVTILHFHSTQHVCQAIVHVVLLVHMSVWHLHNSSISGFNNVFPFIYIFFDHPCMRTYFLCVCLLPCKLFLTPVFTMCILIVILSIQK